MENKIDNTQKILDELKTIRIDIEFIKMNLDENFELSDWAKKELADARKIDTSKCVSNDEVREMILGK